MINNRIGGIAQVIGVVFFLSLMGCATLATEQSMLDGRRALLAGRSADAVELFNRAAVANPNYRTRSLLVESVWTYLGRSYYETGKYAEALAALDKALAVEPSDRMARLYHGLALARSNDRERGRVEIETALNDIHHWLDEISAENSDGMYWDSNRQIRKSIATELAAKPEVIELMVVAQRTGKQLEEEVDRAERDKLNSTYDRGSKN